MLHLCYIQLFQIKRLSANSAPEGRPNDLLVVKGQQRQVQHIMPPCLGRIVPSLELGIGGRGWQQGRVGHAHAPAVGGVPPRVIKHRHLWSRRQGRREGSREYLGQALFVRAVLSLPKLRARQAPANGPGPPAVLSMRQLDLKAHGRECLALVAGWDMGCSVLYEDAVCHSSSSAAPVMPKGQLLKLQ
jgi:hypothetical protein